MSPCSRRWHIAPKPNVTAHREDGLKHVLCSTVTYDVRLCLCMSALGDGLVVGDERDSRILYTYSLTVEYLPPNTKQTLILLFCFWIGQLVFIATISYNYIAFLHSSLFYFRCLLSVVVLASQESRSTAYHPVPKENSHKRAMYPHRALSSSFVSSIRI